MATYPPRVADMQVSELHHRLLPGVEEEEANSGGLAHAGAALVALAQQPESTELELRE